MLFSKEQHQLPSKTALGFFAPRVTPIVHRSTHLEN
jgi:hypothetical protein